MAPKWSSSKSSTKRGTSYFEKPALRTHYFVSNSIFLLCVLVFLGIMVAKYEARMPAFCFFALGGVAFGLLTFWFAVFRVHSEIHGLIATGSFDAPEPGSTADRAFGTVAGLCFQGLLSTAGLVWLCLLTLVEILRAR